MTRFVIFVFCFFSIASAATPPVDISLLVADLKYNENQGVKICEIQQGCMSMFKGYDYIYDGEGLIGENLAQLLSQFGSTFWFVNPEINYAPMKKRFQANGWNMAVNTQELLRNPQFLNNAAMSVQNPNNILDYHAIVYMRPANIPDLDSFRRNYPGIVIFDVANMNYWKDKYKMSTLFLDHPSLEMVKPKWGLYPKKYSKELVARIQEEIGSDLLVIKPRSTAEGKGVIIVERGNLDATLKLIFNSKNTKIPDRGYSYWNFDRSSFFLVEEYVPSDPIRVAEFDNRLFNCTMRVVFALIYHEQAVQLHFLGEYWIIPDLSEDQKGSLNDKNKASMIHPHICAIDPETRLKAKRLLVKPLLMMYKRMLNLDEETIEDGIDEAIVTGL